MADDQRCQGTRAQWRTPLPADALRRANISLKALFDLRGKVAVVTGGSRGLGLQIAEALGEFGATVVLVARKRAGLEAAVERLRDFGVAAAFQVADLTGGEGCDALIERIVADHGRIDILVNNAGVVWADAAERHPLAAWSKVFAVNVDSVFALSQATANRCFLPQASGSIVNVASIEGLRGRHHALVGTAAYNASKAAVINLTRVLAGEWGRRGIRVNALAPGYFPTDMTGKMAAETVAYLRDQTPLGRFGGEQDLKGAALLLASDAGAYINGHTLVVDGGMTAV